MYMYFLNHDLLIIFLYFKLLIWLDWEENYEFFADNQLQNLRKELENANELIEEIKKKGMLPMYIKWKSVPLCVPMLIFFHYSVVHGLLLYLAASTSEHVETLFPHAAATSKLVNSGMSLTQIYNEYMLASENLYLEKEETKRLSNYIDTILQVLSPSSLKWVLI